MHNFTKSQVNVGCFMKNVKTIAIFIGMIAFNYTALILWVDASIIEQNGRLNANDQYVYLINANSDKK